MSRRAFLTPDFASGSKCRSLSIPTPMLPIINGLLCSLMDSWSWETWGDMSVVDCVDMATEMWRDYLDGECSMIGEVRAFALDAAPTGWLACNGAQYQRVDYPVLYDAIATAYHIDADNFVVPDMRDAVVVGTSSSRAVSDIGGSNTHTLTVAEMPSHSHTMPYQACFPYGDIPEVCVTGGLLTTSTGSAGGGQPHNNMQQYHTLLYAIRAED